MNPYIHNSLNRAIDWLESEYPDDDDMPTYIYEAKQELLHIHTLKEQEQLTCTQ